MIPIFKEVNSLDKNCYDKGLNEFILMENAAKAMYDEIKKHNITSVCIISGTGNNGADGIALARMLLGEYDVSLFLPMGVKSDMAKFQLNIYENYGGKYSAFEIDKSQIKDYDCYVDAIFGSGLKRELDPKINKILQTLNKRNGLKIACDIPTGLDINGNISSTAFKADITITMGGLKLSLFSDYAKDIVGKIKIANLGISNKNYYTKSNIYLLQKSDLSLPIRTKLNSHKGSYGHLGVICGDKEGASILAGLSGLNFGAGLVSIITKNQTLQIPYELMKKDNCEGINTIVFGMGMGNIWDNELDKLTKLTIPKVIDADMFYKTEILNTLHQTTILTPHPKEFASLLKITNIADYSIQEIQEKRFELVLKFIQKYPKTILILKGANSIIGYKNQLYINPHGSISLAKGGSGDVLSGLIGSLLAQGYHPLKASINAVLAHSIASDIKPNYSLTPIKLIENITKLTEI